MRSEEQTLEHRLTRRFQKAMVDYSLINDGDKILVGVSGGKDSLCLLELLAKRSRIQRPSFSVEAIHVRMVNIEYVTDTSYLESFCRELDVPLHVVTTHFDDTTTTKKPKCFLCSWHRRKEMFRLAQELRCNKIALGHHNDDIIHTALMNLTFQGQFSTMPAKLEMKKMPLTIIRPLCLIEEKDIQRWSELQQYEQQIKRCPYETASHRTGIRRVYELMQQMNPEARFSIWHALESENKLIEITTE